MPHWARCADGAPLWLSAVWWAGETSSRRAIQMSLGWRAVLLDVVKHSLRRGYSLFVHTTARYLRTK